MTEQKTISEFLSKEYKDFSLYVIENRAIASVIDGLKPVQRKILHVCNSTWKTGQEKTLKVFQLSGKVASDAYYHHGSSSLDSAIINLAQSFKNNLPLLEEDGQFGSLRVPEAGAPRYIGTRLHKNFKNVYTDFELLNHKQEEGEWIEPEYFLPIIPMILINGSSGIAVGFSSNIINRSPIDVISACEQVMKGKKVTKIKPYVPGFNGTFIQDESNHKRWIITGKFERVNTSTIRITELPPSSTLEKYESILDDLVDKKLINSYDNNCKDNIDYTVKMSREALSTYTDEELIKILKLEEYKTEIFSTLDEYGKLKIFESAEEIVKYFVDFRIQFYQKRKDLIISKIERDLLMLSNRARFLKMIIEGKLEVKGIQKNVIFEKLEKNKFDKIDDNYDYLLRMSIWSLTKEMYEKIMQEETDLIAELEKTKKLEPKMMYFTDLQDLRKKLK
jgi:DNA topoisomerase-2